MIERKAKVAVNEWITHGNDAFLLTGARQIGKTYLIRQCLKESGYPYIELNFIEQPELVNLFTGAKDAAHVEGRLELAKTRLKELMVNRLTPDYYAEKAVEIDGMNQNQLIEEIANERARELAIEGHRWFDLRRTTRPSMEKTYVLNGEERTATLTQDDVRYTISFPKEATESNPNLHN